MGWSIVAVTLSVIALVFAVKAVRTETSGKRALKEADEKVAELEQAIVYLTEDDTSGVRIALPAATDVMQEQKDVMHGAQEEIQRLRLLLTAERESKAKLETTLAEVIDQDGKVLHQIRLPGRKVIPNTTPCGSLCKNSFWHKGTEAWRCYAYQGYIADDARSHFIGADGQCAMFKGKEK